MKVCCCSLLFYVNQTEGNMLGREALKVLGAVIRRCEKINSEKCISRFNFCFNLMKHWKQIIYL